MNARKLRPCGRDKDAFSNDQQGGKEDLVFTVSIWISNNKFPDLPEQAGDSLSVHSCPIDSSLVLPSRRTNDYRLWQFHSESTPTVPDVAKRPEFSLRSQHRALKCCKLANCLPESWQPSK